MLPNHKTLSKLPLPEQARLAGECDARRRFVPEKEVEHRLAILCSNAKDAVEELAIHEAYQNAYDAARTLKYVEYIADDDYDGAPQYSGEGGGDPREAPSYVNAMRDAGRMR